MHERMWMLMSEDDVVGEDYSGNFMIDDIFVTCDDFLE